MSTLRHHRAAAERRVLVIPLRGALCFLIEIAGTSPAMTMKPWI
jgi:hypothetical protein